ncbi:MAG: hypothetical protein Q8K89_09410, partial [Actinomycetota bacterium]|nr:hypothetical protein [Actinomycetota bacterium]
AVGCTTLGCHSATGDIRGLDVASCGGNDPQVSCHVDAHRAVDGNDTENHLAGDAQRGAVLTDTVSGLSMPCVTCHTMLLGNEHTRPNSSIASGAGDVCERCHDRSAETRAVVEGEWPGRDTDKACAACHGTPAVPVPHSAITTAHAAVERSTDGTATPGACKRSGCHATIDIRRLHRAKSCAIPGCHSTAGDIRGLNLRSCGGNDPAVSCHNGFYAGQHFVSHSSELTGTVNGVTYRTGENIGCFGCHISDLRTDHRANLLAGAMEGGGATSCGVCHANPDDTTGRGAYATLPAVTAAISARDHRCVACHASGSAADGPSAVASPHKAISSATTLPPSAVWADPLDEWRAAFDATTGGGHNVLPYDLVGGSQDKQFPRTLFLIDGRTYGWTLPPNSGLRQWLFPSVYPQATDATSIQHINIECDDCHLMPTDPVGPQGAATRIWIDPDYSQTEYANPTRDYFQFDPFNLDPAHPANPAGVKPVICFKCHSLYSGSIEGTTAPGGAALHRSHVKHTTYNPVVDRQYYGSKCIDCHTRIPHAWKRPRLLVRTIVATDGVTPDAYPYVPTGYDGLIAVKLLDFTNPANLRTSSCVTGGCYAAHKPTTHPLQSEAA